MFVKTGVNPNCYQARTPDSRFLGWRNVLIKTLAPRGLATIRRLCLIIRFCEILYKFDNQRQSHGALGMKTPAESMFYRPDVHRANHGNCHLAQSYPRLSLHGCPASDRALTERASVDRSNADLTYPSGRYIRIERHEIHCHRVFPT